jgi:hypothetical protein
MRSAGPERRGNKDPAGGKEADMRSNIRKRVHAFGRGWRRLAAAAFMMWVWAFQALASAPPASKIINVADSRALGSGLAKWIADIYNSNYWLYGAVVVVSMAGMGFILGMSFDRLVSLLGIDLGKLEHHE